MPRVLVVDDAADIRLLIERILGPRGWDVVTTGDVGEALAMLASAPHPDVVLLDLQMPDVDGWSALETIRADPATAALPVVLCTVKSGLDDAIRAWQLGADAYITKPFSVDELAQEVTAAATRPRRDRERFRAERLDELRR